MEYFLQQTINGVTLGAIYGLVAIGISLTWASIGMLNLAQGFIFTGAGYSAFLFSQAAAKGGMTGIPLAVGTIAAGMAGGAQIRIEMRWQRRSK